MDIHRDVSTCFEQPCVDIGLDLSPRGFAQTNESFLDAVLSAVQVSPQQSAAIHKQRAFESLKDRLQPTEIFAPGEFL